MFLPLEVVVCTFDHMQHVVRQPFAELLCILYRDGLVIAAMDCEHATLLDGFAVGLHVSVDALLHILQAAGHHLNSSAPDVLEVM